MRMRSRLSGDKKLNRIHRKVMLALKENGIAMSYVQTRP